MAPKIERIVENTELSEGPHWDEETQTLYFVDIPGKAIYSYVPATNKTVRVSTGEKHPSLIIPIRGAKNKFLITLDRELTVISWDGKSDNFTVEKTLVEVEDEPNRFNDGKCDPSGRLWAGTIAPKKGGGLAIGKANFYCYEKSKVRKAIYDVSVSNGLAFNVELKKMYYIDTPKGTIDELDFDIVHGTVDNRRTIFTLSKHDTIDSFGNPDGMTIDTDGNLWVAIFDAYVVIKIDPRKPETLLDSILLPARQPTSVAFGGENLDELYVTTGIKQTGKGELLRPENGAVYKITGLNAKGLPGVSVVL